jgi:DNA polymerase-4
MPPILVVCRDCDWFGETAGAVDSGCPACDSRKTLGHPELARLSMAHLDCDAFFASVEKRDDPSLADRPVLVGGGRRGVVAAACYLARTYGIRSAMPMFEALRRCPDAVGVKPRFEAYREAALQIRALMAALTRLVEPVSIDEAYLALTGTARLHGRPPAAALARLVRQVKHETGLDVSIGLSGNKLLAKLASDLDKPRGFVVIGMEEAARVLAPRPVGIMRGVGPRLASRLEKDGFRTLGALQRAEPGDLARRYGEQGLRLHALAHGRDTRPVTPEHETKSVSAETTLDEDTRAASVLEDRLWALSAKVAGRAKAKALSGRVVTLKLKTARHKVLTRRKTLGVYTNLARVLFDEGRALLREELSRPGAQAYRLVGIGLSGLAPAAAMESDLAFPEEYRQIGKREAAIETLRARFGDGVIGTARDTTMVRKTK